MYIFKFNVALELFLQCKYDLLFSLLAWCLGEPHGVGGWEGTGLLASRCRSGLPGETGTQLLFCHQELEIGAVTIKSDYVVLPAWLLQF